MFPQPVDDEPRGTNVGLLQGMGRRVRKSLLVVAVGILVFGVFCCVLGVGMGILVLAQSPAGVGPLVSGIVSAAGCVAVAVCTLGARSCVVADRLDVRFTRMWHRRLKVTAWLVGAVDAVVIIMEMVIVLGDTEAGSVVLALTFGLSVGALSLFMTPVQRVGRLARTPVPADHQRGAW